MTTLSTMKTRIADELARTDLTSQIGYAISDAISAYDTERWFFSENRDTTFSTVADQEFYTSSDAAGFSNLIAIDYVSLTVADTPYILLERPPAELEWASTNSTSTGQPSWFNWYNESLRLYPIPDGVWTGRVVGAFKPSAPATDDETSNPWMTYAERLIRSRAKLELAVHVLFDRELAADMSAASDEAWSQLKDHTNMQTQQGRGLITPMAF